MRARLFLKRMAQGLSLVVVFVPSLICGFGHFSILFACFTQLFALVPGIPGVFWRAAFYKLTLEDCSIDSSIAFGTFFSRRRVIIAPFVSIGSYCVIGQVQIGPRTQVSSHVEIPGAHQHLRDSQGRLSDSSSAAETYITIGADCWIGATAIIMANVGDQSTIGAGSVVVNDIPARVIAVGVPAKPIKSSIPSNVAPEDGSREV
ncbi:MAG: DapH/DapD/GlmU-related protein [Candidatus Acidiferrum sp.]|jgi:virginiamycin A acetyltransferase